MTLYDMFGRYVWRLYLEVDSDQISGKTKHHERQEHLKDCGIFLDIGPCFLHHRRFGWSCLYVNSVNVVDCKFLLFATFGGSAVAVRLSD